MKAILHIGTEKTGTSYIQEFLYTNRLNLASLGFAFLQSPGKRNNRNLATYAMNVDKSDDHINRIGVQAKDKRDAWKQRFRQNFEKEISKLPKSIHTVILSSEHIHSRLKEPEEIKRLIYLLREFFSEIEVMMFIRRQDRTGCSLFNTKCLCGFPNPVFFNMEKTKSWNLQYNYHRYLSLWKECLPDATYHVKIYERESKRKNNILDEFLNPIDLTLEKDFIIPGRTNQSHAGIILKSIIFLNQALPLHPNGKYSLQNDQLRTYIIENLSKKHTSKKLLPTREEARNFYNLFHESNLQLAKEYLQQDELFDLDFSMYPETQQEFNVSNEILTDIIHFICEYINTQKLS